jgi:hypothetical protein
LPLTAHSIWLNQFLSQTNEGGQFRNFDVASRSDDVHQDANGTAFAINNMRAIIPETSAPTTMIPQPRLQDRLLDGSVCGPIGIIAPS